MDVDSEILKRQNMEKDLAALTSLTFDTDFYSTNKFEGYEQSIAVNDEEDNADHAENAIARKMSSLTAPKQFFNEPLRTGDEDDMAGFNKPGKIIDREDDYRRRRLNRIISPDRNDPFLDKTPGPEIRTYSDVMREEFLKRKEEEVKREIAKKKKEEELKEKGKVPEKPNKRNRWDMSQDDCGVKKAKVGSDWDLPDSTPSVSRKNRWDETLAGGVTPGATPAGMAWDATPKGELATPIPKRQRSRWDETPATMGSATPGATPAVAYTPGVTPFGGIDMATPTPNALMRGAMALLEDRNRPLTDEDLDAMFPQEGYKVLDPPSSYVPIMTPARKILATPTPMGTPLYNIPEENRGQQFDVPKEMPGGLPLMNPEDYQYFGSLMNDVNEDELTPDEQRERKIKKLLLKVKNGTPPQRKTALRQLTDKSREFGAAPLFNSILPLFMEPSLGEQERHLLVKVIDRVLYKLDELVRPFVHKILVVIEPLLIDGNYFARVEGREIISNLSKAAGLATMIANLRPDIDNVDEYVRNTTAKAFSVVASALGIPALLPFLKAVRWQF
ncbi:hypothetical protein CASFOL_008459 [Castilleja foliolosa]|uniref:Splicing factor 3B subunit 1 domain-containing protein n=1 Tax=Castilleja foliolosa TaxID=1961234 RepID=A0ABD3E080_9LAMI